MSFRILSCFVMLRFSKLSLTMILISEGSDVVVVSSLSYCGPRLIGGCRVA